MRREGGRSTLLGVVTADVAAVEFQSLSGPVRVEPVDVGYTGRYRDQLRYVHVELPGTTRLWGPRLLAADGSRIASAEGPDTRFALTPRTVSRSAGDLRLMVGVVAVGGQRIPCSVVVTGPPSAQDRDACVPQLFLPAEVDCTPRRIVIASILPRDAAPRSLQILGIGESARLRLPPASEQCGYRSTVV